MTLLRLPCFHGLCDAVNNFASSAQVGRFSLTHSFASANAIRNQPVMEKSLLAGSSVPVPVRAILQRACGDCHSENTIWPWYAHIPPISLQIHSDVAKGRAFLDLSKWNDYTEGERRGFTVAIRAAIQNHRMPPPKYVWMHPEARLSIDELELVNAWALAKGRLVQIR